MHDRHSNLDEYFFLQTSYSYQIAIHPLLHYKMCRKVLYTPHIPVTKQGNKNREVTANVKWILGNKTKIIDSCEKYNMQVVE